MWEAAGGVKHVVGVGVMCVDRHWGRGCTAESCTYIISCTGAGA